MPITTPPTAPNRADPTTFPARADAWVAWQESSLVPQINALETNVNAKEASAVAAAATAQAAITSINTALNRYTFSTSTTMSDPGVGIVRFNNATLSAVTAIAMDAQSADAGNPNIIGLLANFGASNSAIKGLIRFTQAGTPATFAAFNITAVTNNSGWVQLTVAHVASAGSFANGASFVMEFHRTGDSGDAQALRDDLASTAAGNGAALVGFKQAGTGAVDRTVQDELRQLVNIKQFGAVGDGVTNNDSAFAQTEAHSSPMIYLPEGEYLTTLTNLNKVYVGPGVIKRSTGRAILNAFQSVKSAVDMVSGRAGNLDTINAALVARSASVVFWGDSITEGISQIAYEDSYAGLLERTLRDQFSEVGWTFANYSISGTSTADANNAAYVGAASDSYPTQFYRTAGSQNIFAAPNATLWPSGSTNAKSWRDHIKDASPDLLIIAFGANEVGTSISTFASNLKALITYSQTWTKKPSIALVTNLQPTRKSAPWSGYQVQLQAIADAIRSVAEEVGVSLIDANRMHLAYRDGVDIGRLRNRMSYTFSGGFTENWPNGWLSSGVAPTVSGTYNLTFSGAGNTVKQQSERDLRLSAVFIPAVAANSAFQFVYRTDGADTNAYTAQVTTNAGGTASTCILYYNNSAIASGVVTTVTNGEQVKFELEVRGARHIVKVRGVTVVDVYDYQRLAPGFFGIGFGAGSGTVANWVSKAGNQRVIGYQQLTDDLVYGSVDDFLTNYDSLGGDAIHHPSALGHYAIYFAACSPLIDAIKRATKAAPFPIPTASTSATTGALASGDYIDVTVQGIGGGSVMVGVSTADSSLGATGHMIQQVTGSSAVLAIKKNGADFLTTTINFPYTGKWTVVAIGSVSANGGTLRHLLNGFAFRQ